MEDKKKKIKIRWIDRFDFIKSYVSGRIALYLDEFQLLTRPIWSADRTIWSNIGTFYVFLNKYSVRDRHSVLGIIGGLLSLPIVILVFIVMLLSALVAGSVSTIVGLRNQVDYSWKEQLAVWILPLIALVTLPYFLSNFWLYKVANFFAYALLLVGIDFLFGLCGIVTIGHAGFLTIGSFITTWCYLGTFGFKFNFIVSVLFGGVFSCLIGVLLGFPALKIRDHHLAIVTLCFGLLVPKFLKAPFMADLSGVSTGGVFIEQPAVPNFLHGINADTYNYYLTTAFFLILVLFAYNIRNHSSIGRAFKMLKSDVEVPSITGVPAFRYKLLAFALSAFYAGVAGGLMMLKSRFIAAETYTIQDSIQFNVASLVGGVGNLFGSFIGGIYLSFEPDLGEKLSTMLSGGRSLLTACNGLLLLLVIYLMPSGIAGEIARYFRSRYQGLKKRGSHYMSPPADYDYLSLTKSPVKSKYLEVEKK